MSLLKSVNSLARKSYDGLWNGAEVSPSEYRGINSISGDDHMWMWPDTTFEHGKLFTYKDCFSAVKAFQTCPPLAAVVIRLAQAYINGKTWIMNKAGQEATSPEATKLRALLKKPNPLQSWKEFEAQQEVYMDLFGWFILLPIVPLGYEKAGPNEATSMWNISPHILNIKETNKLFYQTELKGIIESVELKYRNTTTPLKVEKLFIFKDFVPSFDTMVFPDSRIRALEMSINNIIGAMESRNVLINYRGALGAFTQEPGKGQMVSLPLTEDQKKDLQNDFKRYGLRNQQWKFIITSAALKWQQIGIPTRDLMLFEEIEDDIMRICDQYGYPSPLINTATGPSVSNTKAFKQQLYQDAIIPRAEMNYEQWNNIFRLEELGLKMEKDYSAVAVMQEDEVLKANARKARNDALLIEWMNDMITMNRWLYLNGEDTRGQDGDIYYSDWKKLTAPEPLPGAPVPGGEAPATTTPAADE